MYNNIQYDPKVIKQLKKLDKKSIITILDSIEKYAKNPNAKKVIKLKTPFDNTYRLRIGDYRVLFYTEDDLLLISSIAHRKNVYN
ncbi:MAG: Plasmid stabilization system [uncultured Campylobacterales bacterium]|uniref:Plasmid stabilization system n=1 Tax=uncultured Campylobacterales bacterium TaxID=352960 RepID=A0A6S6SU92_9BACT|nr:MAG: Plasmid stabilization system [uncultured Campylobacterales bacterium]